MERKIRWISYSLFFVLSLAVLLWDWWITPNFHPQNRAVRSFREPLEKGSEKREKTREKDGLSPSKKWKVEGWDLLYVSSEKGSLEELAREKFRLRQGREIFVKVNLPLVDKGEKIAPGQLLLLPVIKSKNE